MRFCIVMIGLVVFVVLAVERLAEDPQDIDPPQRPAVAYVEPSVAVPAASSVAEQPVASAPAAPTTAPAACKKGHHLHHGHGCCKED